MWERVQGHADWGYRLVLSCPTTDAAAESPTPDAKAQWLLAAPVAAGRLQASTAEAAARSGDLGLPGCTSSRATWARAMCPWPHKVAWRELCSTGR